MHTRLDARGWVLVAFAGWALLCVIVALTGFGGRYRLLADDPASAPPLPKVVLASTRSTLGPLGDYAEASNRPLFYPDRKPMTVHVAGTTNAAQALNVILTSVILTPTLQMAIVQDVQTKESMRVREGQPLGGAYSGWKLVAMTPRSVVFDGGSQGQTTLGLRVYDGHGGEEPTRMGLTPQAIASGALGAPPPPPPPSPSVMDANANAVPPATQDPTVAQPTADDTRNAAADAADAAANAANAARQAEMIRQRIEQRRQQVQAQGANAPQPNDKR